MCPDIFSYAGNAGQNLEGVHGEEECVLHAPVLAGLGPVGQQVELGVTGQVKAAHVHVEVSTHQDGDAPVVGPRASKVNGYFLVLSNTFIVIF